MNKPEPLKGKRIIYTKHLGFRYEKKFGELGEGFLFHIDDIKSACKFYLRYKDNPKLFSEEQFKIRWEYYSDLGYLVWNMNRKQWENYNEWLFCLAFKDVFEDGGER